MNRDSGAPMKEMWLANKGMDPRAATAAAWPTAAGNAARSHARHGARIISKPFGQAPPGGASDGRV